LETIDGTYYFFKADILANTITYSTDKLIPANLVTISGRRAFEVISMNKHGQKPESLLPTSNQKEDNRPTDLLEQESLTRFDKSKEGARKKKKKNKQSKDKNEGGNTSKDNRVQNTGNTPKANKNKNKNDNANAPKVNKSLNSLGDRQAESAIAKEQKNSESTQKENGRRNTNNEHPRSGDNNRRHKDRKNKGNNPQSSHEPKDNNNDSKSQSNS